MVIQSLSHKSPYLKTGFIKATFPLLSSLIKSVCDKDVEERESPNSDFDINQRDTQKSFTFCF